MVLLLLWVVLAAGCFIYGLVFYKILIRWRLIDNAEPVRGSDLVLVGLILFVLMVQLASIFVPANYYLVLIWLAGAVCLALQNLPATSAYIRRFSRQQKQLPIFWLLAVVVLLYSTLEPANADSAMYHLPSIRWYERFQAIPGLGNLHGRLAFNSSFLVASAAFGFTDLVGQTLFPLNGFLFLVVCWRLLGQIRSVSPYRFLALAVMVLVLYYLIRQVFSPTPDLWATLISITIFMMWLEVKPAFSIRHVLLFMLICLCITVKLATIPVALSLLPLAWAVRKQITVRHWLGLGSLSVLIIAPWLVRTTILSGYLFYPFPAIDLFSFDWKIPIERVRFEKDFVAVWAKFRVVEPYFDQNLLKIPLSEWIPAWWKHKEHYFLNKPIWVLAALSPILSLSHFLEPARWNRFKPLFRPYLIALGGFLFWFLSAPEFRFGYSFIWLTAFIPLMPFLPHATNYWHLLPWSNAVLAGLCSILIGYFAFNIAGKNWIAAQQHLLVPKPLTYRNRGTEAEFFKKNYTHSGLLVLTPVQSPWQQSCYDQELPCSPYYFSDLELRGRSIAAGFRSSLQQTK